MELRYRHTVLVLTMGAFFAVMGGRLVISPLVPSVMDAYGVSKGTVGLALTAMWAAYGLAQFPGGILGDRHGERRVVLAGLAAACAGALLVATAPSFPVFLLATALVGVGGGLYFPSAASLLTRLFENTGQALSLHVSGGNMAGLVTPLIAAYVGVRYGWRSAIVVGVGIILVALAVGAWRIRPTPPRRPEVRFTEEVDVHRVVSLLTRPSIAYTTTLAILMGFCFQAVLSFFPTFLVEFHGLSTVRASTVFSTIFVLIVVVLPFMGRLSDRTSPDVALAVCASFILAGVSVSLVRGWGPAVLAGAVLLGTGTTWGGVVGARYMAHLSTAEQGTGYGLVRSVYVFVASAGNALVGLTADAVGWVAAFGLMALLLVAALALLGVNHAFDLDL